MTATTLPATDGASGRDNATPLGTQRWQDLADRLQAAAALIGAGVVWSYLRKRHDGAPVRSVPTLLPGLLAPALSSGFLALDVSYADTGSVEPCARSRCSAQVQRSSRSVHGCG